MSSCKERRQWVLASLSYVPARFCPLLFLYNLDACVSQLIDAESAYGKVHLEDNGE